MYGQVPEFQIIVGPTPLAVRVILIFQKKIFQDSDRFLQDSKIRINRFTPKISMLILLTVSHTFHIFYSS